MPAELRQKPADGVARMDRVGREDVRPLALPLLA